MAAKVTVAVITVCGGTMLAMHVLYNHLLNRLMTDEDRRVGRYGWLDKAM